MVDAWLTREQAAAHAQVHVRTIDAWRKNGLPTATVGRIVRINKEDLDAWMAKEMPGTRELLHWQQNPEPPTPRP